MEQIEFDFVIRTIRPVSKTRLESLKEYMNIVARRVGLYIHTTIVKEAKDG